MKVCQRDLGGADHPQLIFDIPVDILLKFWHLAGAPHADLPDHGRGVDLGVPMFASVDIQHPADQRTLQASAQPFQNIKAGT